MWYSSGPKSGVIWIKDSIKLIPQISGEFLRYLLFTPSRADQDLWICKYDEYEGYYYIATRVDEFIIAAKNLPTTTW